MGLDFFHNVHKVPPDQLDMALDASRSMYPNMIPMLDPRPSYPEAVLNGIVDDYSVNEKVHIPQRPELKPNMPSTIQYNGGIYERKSGVPKKAIVKKWSPVLDVDTPRAVVKKAAMYKTR